MREIDPPPAGEARVPTGEARLRRATAEDAPALVRLRALMLEAMDIPVGPEQAPWRADAHAWFVERLGRPEEFAAFLVEDLELGVVSCAVGSCDRHAPGPANPSGLHGHVFNVSTDPSRRGRGHARACLEALLAWFTEDTGVRVVNLNATADGAGLYRSLGFAAPRFPALQLRIGTGG